MGCDIHWVLELKTSGKWVGVLCGDFSRDLSAGDRWYAFFEELANVRGESDTAEPQRGLPPDISDLTRYSIDCGNWEHSKSWLTLAEFMNAHYRACMKFPRQNTKAKLFGSWPVPEPCDKYRVVFAFDN